VRSPSADANAFLLRAVASVRAADLQAGNAAQRPEALDAPVVRDYGNGLFAVYLVDEGQHFAYVQNRHLASSKFTREGLHECALNNLAQRAQGKAKVQQHGPISAVFLDGMFEASLVLLDHLWDETLASKAPDGFVVALPARDVLAFCNVKSAEGIEALRGVVNRVFPGGDHLLTRTLYRRREGRWEPMPAT
jgi:uncharacterized protein YtpQ (UPF0354 family)